MQLLSKIWNKIYRKVETFYPPCILFQCSDRYFKAEKFECSDIWYFCRFHCSIQCFLEFRMNNLQTAWFNILKCLLHYMGKLRTLCSHEIKRRLFLGRKVMTNLDSILKSRDITLSTKVRLVKAMVFPVVTNGCESWTIKKGECQRIDAFELWCWRRLLRVPWTARRSNQSILKEISPECSLEGLMLKLKLQNLAT